MPRFVLGSALTLALASAIFGSAAWAQQSTTATTSGTTTSTGIAKPPPGTVPPQPRKIDHNNPSSAGQNVPTLPQVALHPEATIGSGVPMAGPGGTTRSPTGD